jgi:hypothetical protein
MNNSLNEIVIAYCKLFNLDIKQAKYENEYLIYEGKNQIGHYHKKSKYININKNEYKKSDMLILVLEEQKIH